MNLPKYTSASLCTILCAIAATSFAADPADANPAPMAVPAAEQTDFATQTAEAEVKAAAEKAKAEAEARAAAEKAKQEAEAKAATEKAKQEAEAKAAAEKAKAEAEAKAAAEKAKAEAEAKAAAEKAKAEAEAKAATEKAKQEAEAKAAAEKAEAEAKAADMFETRFPELAKAIADANLSGDKKDEVDVLSANLMASSDALIEISGREDAQPAEKLEAEIECLTHYTAILAAVPSPENEALLTDRRLELQTAREDRLFLAQKDYEEGRIDAAQLSEIEERYLKLDTVPEAETAKTSVERKEPFWGYKKHKPLPFLLIVANYRIPRKVIAEYLRTEYDVPYILLPSNPGKPSKDDQVYFSGGRSSSGEVEVALPAPQLSRFIAYLRPETVIILGDDSYINPVYRLAVPDSVRKVEFANDEWKVNTVRLDEFFRKTLKTDVSDHYLDFLQNQGAAAEE